MGLAPESIPQWVAQGIPVDRYVPLAELGQGASGLVYLCRDRFMDTLVALKVLKTLTKRQLIAFQREARTSSTLDHPNIAKVLDFGPTRRGDTPYMVMQYTSGMTLQQYLKKNGPLEIETALHLFRGLCDALEYAHAKGSMHCDLKPSNIWLAVRENGSKPWKAMIIDFGMSKVTQPSDGQTMARHGALVGTPAYMPPEIIAGQVFDQRSEIYSLGCVMFESITARLPFECESSLKMLFMHANQPAPLPSKVAGRETTLLDATIARCLSKRPEDRFQSIAALRAELRTEPPARARTASLPPVTPVPCPVPGAAKSVLYLSPVSILWLMVLIATIVSSVAIQRASEENAYSNKRCASTSSIMIRHHNGRLRDAQFYHQQGLAEMQTGQYAAGLRHLDRAVALNPECIQYRLDRADALFQLEQFTFANKEYKSIAHAPGRTPSDFFLRAQALHRMCHFQAALIECDRARVAGVDSHELPALRGRIYLAMDRLSDARLQFQKALAIKPNAPSYLGLATCFRRLDDVDQAHKALVEAKKFNSHIPEIYLQSAMCDLLLDKHQEARNAYDKWCSLIPIELNKYPTWESFKRYSETEIAIETYSNLLANEVAFDALPLFKRGLLYLELARYELAAEDMEKYLKVTGWRDSSGVKAACIAYICYRLSGRFHEAQALRQQASKLRFDLVWPFPIFAFLSGDHQLAKLEALADNRNKKTEAGYFMALSAMLHNDDERAIRLLERLVSRADNQELVEYRLAAVECQRLKHRKELRKVLEKMSASRPKECMSLAALIE